MLARPERDASLSVVPKSLSPEAHLAQTPCLETLEWWSMERRDWLLAPVPYLPPVPKVDSESAGWSQGFLGHRRRCFWTVLWGWESLGEDWGP